MRTLAEKVARLRERKGWSQERLAGAASIGASTIAHIELGSRTACQPATLRALAGALEVPVEYLIADEPTHYLRVRLATLPHDELTALSVLPLHERLRWALQDLAAKWGEPMSLPALAARMQVEIDDLERLLKPLPEGAGPDAPLLLRLAEEIGLPHTFLLPDPALVDRYAAALALAASRGLTPDALRDLIMRSSVQSG